VEIEVLGIDLAKNVFQLHGVDRRGRPIYRRRVYREQLLAVVGDIPSFTLSSKPAQAPSIGRGSLRRSGTA
jgi:transposase